MRGGLIYRGKSGYFFLKSQVSSGKGGYLHLWVRLTDLTVGINDVLESYCRYKKLPPSAVEYFCIGPLKTRPGCRYGRIMRPVRGRGAMAGYRLDEAELRSLLDEYAQLDAFMRRFDDIARVIYPDRSNLDAYGFEIRSLLILACTEVEMLFKSLFWKDYSSIGANMPIFFKGSHEAKLPYYRVKLNFYPHIESLRPFGVWGGSDSYVPLGWYQAYNKTKHNRQSGFEQANLSSLIHALAACAILLRAQTANLSLRNVKHPALERFVSAFAVEEPQWTADEHYWVLPNRPLTILPVPGIV